MTLLELLKEHGTLELSLMNLNDGGKVFVNVSGPGGTVGMILEDVAFATGGAITLAQDTSEK